MMKTKKIWIRRIMAAVGMVLLAAAYLNVKRYTGELESSRHTAVLLMDQNPLSASAVKQMLEQEQEQETPRSFAAWTQENEVLIQNKDLNRSHMAAAVSVCGCSSLVLRGTAWMDETDQEGCLVDTQTAKALFGSTDVTGMTVEVQGRTKQIRGLLYGVTDTILFQAEEEKMLNRLTIAASGDSYAAIRQEFLMRYALDGAFLKMDILYRMANAFSLLIVVAAGGSLAAQMIKSAWRRRREKWGLYEACAAGACIFILAFFLLHNLEIPRDMIPTKWSDFGFWKSWWESERQSFLLLLLTEKQKPQQICVSAFGRAALWSAAALLCVRTLGKYFHRSCK